MKKDVTLGKGIACTVGIIVVGALAIKLGQVATDSGESIVKYFINKRKRAKKGYLQTKKVVFLNKLKFWS